jgi:hypothetical protein
MVVSSVNYAKVAGRTPPAGRASQAAAGPDQPFFGGALKAPEALSPVILAAS